MMRVDCRNSAWGVRTTGLPWANDEAGEELPEMEWVAGACGGSEWIKGGEQLAEIYCDGGALSLSWKEDELVQLRLPQLLLLLLMAGRT